MSPGAIPDHRLAICRRCRWPSRIAAGAESAEALLECGRAWAQTGSVPTHVRLSQCLNCCDGGHTVRVECRGVEVALVGVRTSVELERVLERVEELGEGKIPERLRSRVWQVWRDGRMVWHRNV